MKRILLALFGLCLSALVLPAPATAQQSVMQVGPQTLAHNQVTVSTSPVLVLPSRPYRQRTTVTIMAANQCYFGNSNVSTTNGWGPAPVAGTSFQYDNASPLYAVCAASTTVSYLEGY